MLVTLGGEVMSGGGYPSDEEVAERNEYRKQKRADIERQIDQLCSECFVEARHASERLLSAPTKVDALQLLIRAILTSNARMQGEHYKLSLLKGAVNTLMNY